MRPVPFVFLILLSTTPPQAACAQDTAAEVPQAESPTEAPTEAKAPPAKAPANAKKGRRAREIKEAEGTEALGRFEADTVIKSKYELDGKSLEVDPD